MQVELVVQVVLLILQQHLQVVLVNLVIIILHLDLGLDLMNFKLLYLTPYVNLFLLPHNLVVNYLQQVAHQYLIIVMNLNIQFLEHILLI